MSDDISGTDKVIWTFSRNPDAPPQDRDVPQGWTRTEMIAELLRAAEALVGDGCEELDIEGMPYRARMLKFYAGSFHTAMVTSVQQPMLDGPATIGKLLNGQVADTNQRYCFEPPRAMAAAVDRLCDDLVAADHRNEMLRNELRGGLWCVYMMLKGWAVDAVEHGSGVFNQRDCVQLSGLERQVCRALRRGNTFLARKPQIGWCVGTYDQRVASCDTATLVNGFKQWVSDTLKD